MKCNAATRLCAVFVSILMVFAMTPSAAFAVVGAANTVTGTSSLVIGTSNDLVAQADELPAGDYLVTVNPQGDSTCSYTDLQVWITGKNGEVFEGAQVATSYIPSLWDPRDYSFALTEAPDTIHIRIMWKGPIDEMPTQLDFEEPFPSDYNEHSITAKAEGPGLDEPIEAVVGTYYVEYVGDDSENVPLCYVDQYENPQQQDDWEYLDQHEGGFDSGGWFAVRGQVNLTQITFLSGDFNLVLCDDSELKCNSGVLVIGKASLTIWSQRKGTGRLTARGQKNNQGQFNPYTPNNGYGDAGIGGYGIGGQGTACGDITINGGIITATGGPGAAGIGGAERSKSGSITINRGSVTAKSGGLGVDHSGLGAGIGSGAKGGDAGPITINGGTVDAEGGTGIGGGNESNSSAITITGGNVHARSMESRGAAIGGGWNGTNKGDIIISGGVVKAETFQSTSSQDGGAASAAIGAGYNHDQGGAIIIRNGAVVVAIARGYGAGIGGGAEDTKGKSGGVITISDASTRVVALSLHGAGIGSGGDDYGVNSGGGHQNGGTITINDGVVFAQSYGSGAGIGGGNNGSGGTITINGGCVMAYGGQIEYSWKHGQSHSMTAQSDEDGLNMIALAEIPNMDSASDPINGFMDDYLYGVIADSVLDLIFSGRYGGAGIGGGDDGAGGTITINGGVVEARGGMNSVKAIGWGDGGRRTVDLSIYDPCKVTYGDVKISGANQGTVDKSTLKVVYGSEQGVKKATSYAYALIEPTECIVSFDMGGHGEALEAQGLSAGEKAQQPISPEADGWAFDGWYKDKDFTEHFDFDEAVYTSTTLYAKWLKTYPLTIQKVWADGAKPPASVTSIEMYCTDTWDEWGNGCGTSRQVFLRADNDWKATIDVTEESVLELTETTKVQGFVPESWSVGSGTGKPVIEGAIDADGNAVIDLTSAAVTQLVTGKKAVLSWTSVNTKALTVEKVWDIDYSKHYKPESLDVVLQGKQSGAWTNVETLTLSDDNDWKGTFSPVTLDTEYRIRELDAKGNPVLDRAHDGAAKDSQVEFEVTPEYGKSSQKVNYQVSYEVDAVGNTTIVNAAGKKIHVTITWNPGDESAPQPDSVKVNLLYDQNCNDWMSAQYLTLSAATGWEGDFLPEFGKGRYRVCELDAAGQTANEKGIFAVESDGATRKYEFGIAYDDDIVLSGENNDAETLTYELANSVTGTIYTVTKSWVATSRVQQEIRDMYAVLQHKEADGTWKTIGTVAESNISQLFNNLMEQVGGVRLGRDNQWTAEFSAVPYGEDDDNYRVREVISDHSNYYGDGCVLEEGEGEVYKVRDNTYHVKTLLAADDEDNTSGESPSFVYRHHVDKWSGKSDWDATFNVSYEQNGNGNFTITNAQQGAHTVTFDSNGAGYVPSQVVEHGQLAQEPDYPVIEGMLFIGWQQVKDGVCSPYIFEFSTPITEDITLRAFFTDPHELGRDNYEIKTLDGAPIIDSENMTDVTNYALTEDEVDADYSLLLVSSPLAEDEVPSADKAALTAQATSLGATAGVWFDISLYKMQGETIMAKLSKTSVPVMLTAEIPQALHKSGRTFFLLRYHDGAVTTVAQGTGATFAWESDVFSTYLIAYADAAPTPTSKPVDTTPTPSSKSVSTAPKTGDQLLLTGVVLAITAITAAGVVVLFAARRRRQ